MQSFLKDHKKVTAIVTAYLIIYTILHQAGASLPLLGIMFLLSPVMVIWMAYTILRYGKYTGTSLKEDQEWGYEDKDRSDLGMF